MAATVKNETTGKKGFMPKFEGFEYNPRKIICSSEGSKREKDGVIRLYEALVPRKEIKRMLVNVIRRYFPTFEDIDVDMIINEAFPKFEETIGVENFAKVKKFFGIGCKASKNQNSKEIESLLAKLRTIENAQYYICGYKDLVLKMANLIEGGEQYTNIEKVKICRMYCVLFLFYIYFVEDLGYGARVNDDQLIENNKLGFYPEELFVLYITRFKQTTGKDIFFDAIRFEVDQIKDNKRVLKELLDFSELEYDGERFFSVNKANPYQNFGQVRNVKQKIHNEPVILPLEYFGIFNLSKQELDFVDLYGMYKELTSCELEKFNRSERNYERFEGSRIIKDKYLSYEVRPFQCVSGEREKNRLLNWVEILAQKNLEMLLKTDFKTGKEKTKKYNVRQFLAAIKFAKDAKLAGETTLIRDFEIADELIKRDKKKNVLSRYFQGDITIPEVKAELKIDETIEFEFFGIKPKVDHKEVLVNFAIQNGYATSRELISAELIENILIPGNEEIIEQFHSGEIGIDKFEKKLGFDSNFAEMFFDISKIDIGLLEEKLLEAKRSSVVKKKFDHRLKLIVLLYVFIVEGQIKCGPKNRVPKRNKALKTSILKTLV